MRLERAVAAAVGVILVTACATTVQLSEQDKSRLTSVQISSQVAMPQEAAFIGGLASLGALGARGSSWMDC